MTFLFTRIALFLVMCCGWGILFFGGWIAWRGVAIYAGDPVLMGTGGGLAIGGLLVVALSLGGWVQLATARDVAAIRARLQAPTRDSTPGARATPPLPAPRRD